MTMDWRDDEGGVRRGERDDNKHKHHVETTACGAGTNATGGEVKESETLREQEFQGRKRRDSRYEKVNWGA